MDIPLHDEESLAAYLMNFWVDEIAEVLVEIGKRLSFPRQGLRHLAGG